MSGRPVFHRELGRYLRELREAAGLGQRQAAELLRRRKLANVSDSTLNWLENGRTKHPNPALLRAIAELYRTSYDSLLRRVVRDTHGRDLVDHSRGIEPPSRTEEADAHATETRVLTARIAELEELVKHLTDTLADVATLAGEIVSKSATPPHRGGKATAADRKKARGGARR